MKKLAVFDLDGTLHNTELALAPAIARAVSDITGLPEPSYSLINSLYGEPLEEFCRVLIGRNDDATYREFMKGVRKYQKITIPEVGALYAGVKEMLQELKTRGFSLAILSNAHLDYIEEVAGGLGILDMFESYRGRTGEASKTERLRELSSDYDFTVMAGDRYHDVQAALELDLPAVGCRYGYGKEDELKGSAIAESPRDIVVLVEEALRART